MSKEYKEIRISHPEVEGEGRVMEESLPVWLDLGWSVVEDAPVEEAPKYVTRFIKGKETMVLETALPDEKESDQDIDVDPKEF